jgi:predicted MPP superfamily phosphohydrolase
MSGNTFFSVVLGIYVTINGYMFARLFFTLEGSGLLRGLASAVFLVFALSFPASRLLSNILPGAVTDFLSIMGYLYLGPMIYGFLLTLAADILRILNYHMTITANPPPYTMSGREGAVTFIVALSLAICLAGAVNTMYLVPVDVDVEWDGPPYREPIRIALVSDIHLGKLVGPGHLRRIAALINSRSPDIVLIAGDSIDSSEWLRMEDRRSEAASILASLEPRLGIWAVPGNHDYYAGIEESVRFLESAGVRVLRDDWAVPGGELIIIGRDDLSVTRYGDSAERRSLRELASDAARTWGVRNLPVVVMDHQPFNLEEAAESGVDLQLSGHTHRGQLFPVNFVIAAMYEKHYGLYAKDGTSYYISSGAGTWGPPMRTIGRPEVVFINLHTRQSAQ